MWGMMEHSSVAAKLRLEGFEALPRACAPSGVYALCADGEVLYVGQAKNVYQRLTTHYNAKRRIKVYATVKLLSPGDVRVNPIPYDSVMVKWVPIAELDRIERELILRLRPKFNIQIREPLPKVKVDLAALGITRLEGLRRRKIA